MPLSEQLSDSLLYSPRHQAYPTQIVCDRYGAALRPLLSFGAQINVDDMHVCLYSALVLLFASRSLIILSAVHFWAALAAIIAASCPSIQHAPLKLFLLAYHAGKAQP